jgi:hypothetical protein
MAWWRAHDEAVDDPKLQRLPGELFKTWFNLLCLASRNGGVLPSTTDMAFGLRKSEKEVQRAVDALIEAKLFDVSETGTEPHNWNGRQYKSDVSTGRVRSFRKRKRERSGKPHETVSGNAPEQNRAELGEAPPGLPPDEHQTSPPATAHGALEAPAHDGMAMITELAARKRV